MYRGGGTLAYECVPPQVGLFPGRRGCRWLGGDSDERRLARLHKPELLAGDRLDVLVGVQVLLKGGEALVAGLQVIDLRLKLALLLRELVGANEIDRAGAEEVHDHEAGSEENYLSSGETR